LVLDNIFSGKIRIALLTKLLLNPASKVYLRGLERDLGVSSNTVRTELNKLQDMHLIEAQEDSENTKVKNHIVEYDFTYYYIVEYISKILFKYTVQGSLKLLDYFNNVFLKNIDIWGLTIIYMSFLDNLYENYKDTDKMNLYHLRFIEKIKYIIIHFLFENPTEAININELASELRSLNNIITQFDKKENNSILSKYVTSLTKISNDDIKEIGGNSKRKNRSCRTNRTNKKTTKRRRN
jgi:DNA-binding transcriptional ArsR family regulator